ncbi:hypothetical protein [Stratiformator vulcanicus]|uniref:Restriction endonuclease BglII n=1 Tax=Stratiformator vulcanicus TaxID=2527980 RepID=A0A517R564_9PLAN|nr:hypothetical protein [Stratiformator vulcanicus]QDT39024.1 hypothetical protein Pan189_34250 [Stratiformator vulcanicus]
MINWIYYPKSDQPTSLSLQVVKVFEDVETAIESGVSGKSSNEVLAMLRPGLEQVGFTVESGKKASERIAVPVLFGRNGKPEKSFHADAYHEKEGYVIEVEAGRGVVNNQFLKDLFQACMMHDVEFLSIAVCNWYGSNRDFESVERFFDTMYTSQRLQLPLKGILLVGY